jgi:RsiW-degrading membrane proteinase PrsW (M82 family)
VTVKEAVLFDKMTGSEILRSPVFRFLAFVAIVPLGIQLLKGNHSILYGLALWSMVLWALLLYRLFADRELKFRWAIGTVLFTSFIGLPLLELWLAFPVDITTLLIEAPALSLRLGGYVFGVGVREEMCKALPLLLIALFTKRMRNPTTGLVLGMMSGVGFAGGENVYYVYRTLNQALTAMKETGQAGYLVWPVYNNVVRMAMTPFLPGCFSAIFGYFIALAAGAAGRRRLVFLVLGLGLSSFLHGLYDTMVGWSALVGVAIQLVTFFLVMTYILKARGLTSARELGGGIFNRTVMLRAVDVAGIAPPAPAPAAPAPAPTIPPSRTPRPAPSATWRLRGLAGPAAGRTFDLDGEAILGRDARRCLVHLEEPTVSREHATLRPDPARAGWAVQRLSRHGWLLVNGEAVDEADLQPGDRIQVGSSVLVLEAPTV